jgi:hypothetical protein
MSDPSTGSHNPRPRPVTVAGVIAASTCVLLVLWLLDIETQVRSIEVRHSITDTLKSRGWQGLVSVSEVIAIMHGIIAVSAALSAAGLVLAIYCLRRHRAARIGLSVVAVCLLFTATLVTGPLPLAVAYGAARLWRRDARDWFDGRPTPAGPPPSTS